jgi:hypothetical protein
MAKKARKAKKAKSKSNKTKAKTTIARKTKARVRKPASPEAHPLHSMLINAVSRHVVLSLSDKKSDAVNACVNAEMDIVSNSWNDSGHMDKDYHQTEHTISAFLNDVQICLAKKGFNFKMNDPGLIKACKTAAVYQVKLLVYGRTT